MQYHFLRVNEPNGGLPAAVVVVAAEAACNTRDEPNGGLPAPAVVVVAPEAACNTRDEPNGGLPAAAVVVAPVAACNTRDEPDGGLPAAVVVADGNDGILTLDAGLVDAATDERRFIDTWVMGLTVCLAAEVRFRG